RLVDLRDDVEGVVVVPPARHVEPHAVLNHGSGRELGLAAHTARALRERVAELGAVLVADTRTDGDPIRVGIVIALLGIGLDGVVGELDDARVLEESDLPAEPPILGRLRAGPLDDEIAMRSEARPLEPNAEIGRLAD